MFKSTLIRFFGIILIVSILIPVSNSYAQTHTDWSYNLSVYEVNVRQYSRAGTFKAFSEDLDRLQEMGAGILWLMPVHPIGVENRLGSLGSYYSVQNYMDVSSDYGTMADFKDLVKEIHARDMYVIIDWVANHTSWDNVLTDEHPEWYVTDNNGNFTPPPGTDWSDVIELDFNQDGLREYMIDALKFWIDSTGVDGFRFDAVSYVPDDFWKQATDSLKAHKPDVFLLAEGADEKYFDLGFDMNYAWDLYAFGTGILVDIADGDKNGSSLASYSAGEKSSYPNGEYRMYFTSNHDENSWHGTTYELFGNYQDLFTVYTATFHGLPLLYNGQESGLNKRLEFFEKDLIPWGNYPKQQFIKGLLQLKKRNPALWNGDPENFNSRMLTNYNSSILAYKRSKGDDAVMVHLNISPSGKTYTPTSTAYYGTWRNIFTNDTLTFSEPTEFQLNAWGFNVYEAVQFTGTNIETEPALTFELHQNYPNPFNPATLISYQLPAGNMVSLTVFDAVGREVKTLVEQQQNAGYYEVTFDGNNLSSGVYLYRLQIGSESITRKMLLLK